MNLKKELEKRPIKSLTHEQALLILALKQMDLQEAKDRLLHFRSAFSGRIEEKSQYRFKREIDEIRDLIT